MFSNRLSTWLSKLDSWLPLNFRYPNMDRLHRSPFGIRAGQQSLPAREVPPSRGLPLLPARTRPRRTRLQFPLPQPLRPFPNQARTLSFLRHVPAAATTWSGTCARVRQPGRPGIFSGGPVRRRFHGPRKPGLCWLRGPCGSRMVGEQRGWIDAASSDSSH